jgi:hypothetical protein
MRKEIFILILAILSCAFALQKPTNYYAAVSATGGVRGNQQQVQDFAVWNATSKDWANVIPPNLSGGQLYGTVAVGTGLLAYGSFTSIGGNAAAGLAYYDGNVWAAPEGVGLYSLANFNSSFSYYDNIPSGIGTAYAAVADSNNNVYIWGVFDQVGLCRTGVAGFVQLVWAAPGIFTVKQLGNGYYKSIPTVPASAPCSFCAGDNIPPVGTVNKMRMYTSSTSSQLVFVVQPNSPGDLWQWEVNTPNWVQITYGNGAVNITGNVKDFDIAPNSNNIFVVGLFQRLNDPVSNYRYQHIAVSTDNGQTFTSFGPALNQTLFGDQPAVTNQYGVVVQPAYSAYGFYSVLATSTSQVWVAGSVRDGYRSSGQGDAYPNEAATRVFSFSSGSGPSQFSDRFAPYASANGVPQQSVNGPVIYKLALINGNVHAFGDFTLFKQVATPGIRFATRYTTVMKNAAVYDTTAQVWSPAFGGFLTSSGDTSPSFNPSNPIFLSVGSVNGNSLVYFSSQTNGITSTYGLLSGSMFAYGGDAINNANNRWNVIFGPNRLVTFSGTPQPTSGANFASGPNFAPQPLGNDGQVNCLLILQKNDAIIFGGNFDYIGNMQVPGVGFWNQDLGIIGSVGGGLFYYNNVPFYQSDSIYNNRIGGNVLDLEEYNNYLYAAGLFNRNNSGNSLANIAAISYRTGGAGWIPVDGGCDNQINDILVVGSILYATGKFQYCGLNSAGYNSGNLFRGRVPTSYIAAIELDSNPAGNSWRPLGIGLQGGAGYAMTYRRGYLYVGGAFSNAGGVINSAGIAKWDGNSWSDVTSSCQGPCDRAAPNRLPYIGTNIVPTAAARKPPACNALSTIQGNVWCIDTGATTSTGPLSTGLLAWWDGSNWYQAGPLNVASGVQNSAIVNNQSRSSNILVPGSTKITSNGFNFFSWGIGTQNYEISFTGFSVQPSALAAGSLVVFSQLLVAFCLIVSFVFFF